MIDSTHLGIGFRLMGYDSIKEYYVFHVSVKEQLIICRLLEEVKKMSNREYAKAQIDTLPEIAVEKVIEFISYQKYSLGLYDNETDYLLSVPGMAEKIKDGLATPLSECVPLSEVWPDV